MRARQSWAMGDGEWDDESAGGKGMSVAKQPTKHTKKESM